MLLLLFVIVDDNRIRISPHALLCCYGSQLPVPARPVTTARQCQDPITGGTQHPRSDCTTVAVSSPGKVTVLKQ